MRRDTSDRVVVLKGRQKEQCSGCITWRRQTDTICGQGLNPLWASLRAGRGVSRLGAGNGIG